MDTTTALVGVITFAIGIAAGYAVRRYWVGKQLGGVEEKIKKDLSDAGTRAKEIVLEAKEKAASILVEQKNEEKERRKEIDALEARVLQREESFDKKLTDLTAEQAKVRSREDMMKVQEEELKKKEDDIEGRLQKVGGLSMADAREEIFRKAKEDRSQDLAHLIQKMDGKTGKRSKRNLQRLLRLPSSAMRVRMFPRSRRPFSRSRMKN